MLESQAKLQEEVEWLKAKLQLETNLAASATVSRAPDSHLSDDNRAPVSDTEEDFMPNTQRRLDANDVYSESEEEDELNQSQDLSYTQDRESYDHGDDYQSESNAKKTAYCNGLLARRHG